MLTRNEFRKEVFERDNYKCVICSSPAQDAHHIIERRLWPNGGYFLKNGASLCGPCHLKAESTEISCDEIRQAAKIDEILLPPHLYRDLKYDKWANIIRPDGTKIPGELFYDESVQKILAPVLSKFVKYYKYPRTYHLPNSPGATKDDRVLPNIDHFKGVEVVVTEKMDGENTTIYNDYCHARSIDVDGHPSKDWVKNFAAKIGWEIPNGWRICGENLWAKHSIEYTDLEDYFLVFSIWNDVNECLCWDETKLWCEVLNLKTVPILYQGLFREEKVENLAKSVTKRGGEGIVVRAQSSFPYSRFRYKVAKWVRANHVQTAHNWKRQTITRNKLKQEN